MSGKNKYGLHESSFEHVCYGLFVGAEGIKAFCEKHELPPLEFDPEQELAVTHHLRDRETGETLALVVIRDLGQLNSKICGMIVHEAAHVWQNIREAMDEESPSHEFEAYSLQWIVHDLIVDYGIATNSERMPDET